MPKFTKFDGVKRCWWYFCGKGGYQELQNELKNVKMVVAESSGGLHLAMRKWDDGLYTM